MVPRTAIDLIRALPTLFPSTLAPLPPPPLGFHVLLPLVAFLFSNPLPSLSLSLSLLLSVVRLSAADHLSSAPPSRLAARLPPIIIFNSPWWSASPPSVVLFFSSPFLFVRWSPSSSSLNIRERKKKKRRKERKEKVVGNIIATFLHFAAFWKIRTWRGEKLEPWWAGCQSSSLTNSGWNGERYH